MAAEHPILYTAHSVRAYLGDTKTQTRRIINPQPKPCRHKEIFGEGAPGHDQSPDWQGQTIDWIDYKYQGREGWFCHVCGNGLKHIDGFSAHGIICPFGQTGDRLWVRETYWTGLQTPTMPVYITYDTGHVEEHRVTLNFKPQRIGRHPSIHLPRWASRLTQTITGIRVERLQGITEEDAQAEGVEPDGYFDMQGWKNYFCPGCLTSSASLSYQSLWNKLNRKRGYGWEGNPWVWVISYPKYSEEPTRTP